MISRVAEEFHCLPDVATEALENDTNHLILTILMLRSFARTKEIYDASESKEKLPESKMMDLLVEIEFDCIRNSMKANEK